MGSVRPKEVTKKLNTTSKIKINARWTKMLNIKAKTINSHKKTDIFITLNLAMFSRIQTKSMSNTEKKTDKLDFYQIKTSVQQMTIPRVKRQFCGFTGENICIPCLIRD